MLSSAIKTPQIMSRVPFGVIHPSKIHQSTAKSTKTLSSHPVNDVAQRSPNRPVQTKAGEDTPCKSRPSLAKNISSPSFDFSFERPESDLSVEAQRIMDSVREEAAKIKAQMIEERAKQSQHDGETNKLYGIGEREIRQPKGKSGRFSDVHEQGFKKMDSIANHASTWKNKVHEGTAPLLKRSPSKAGLDETTPKSMSKSKSMRSLHFNSDNPMGNPSPGKRVKRDLGDDTSFTRPVSRDNKDSPQKTPSSHLINSRLPSAVTTPTKASLARSSSVRDLKPSKLPSLSHSASTKLFRGDYLEMPRTEGSNRYTSSLSRFGGNVKSILRHTQPKYSEDPQKLAAGTHLPLPKATFNLEKDLPPVPDIPVKDPQATRETPTIKRVNFSEPASVEYPKLATSPSKSKLPTLKRPESTHSPTHTPAPSSPKPDLGDQVTYPLLATSPNITTRRPLPKPTTPGDFTFRANSTIEFSPNKMCSPGGTTIRIVRPSGFPTPMPGTFDLFPSIPHGMSNKKRKHDEDTPMEDVSEDTMKENGKPTASEEHDDDEGQPRAKKQRIQMASSPSVEAQATNQSPLKRRFAGRATRDGSRIPKKSVMNLARLTVLARPKDRR